MILNLNTFNIKLLKFNKIIKNEYYTYSIIKYNSNNLKIKIDSIKFLNCFFNQNKNIFVLKFDLNDNDKFIEFMNVSRSLEEYKSNKILE